MIVLLCDLVFAAKASKLECLGQRVIRVTALGGIHDTGSVWPPIGGVLIRIGRPAGGWIRSVQLVTVMHRGFLPLEVVVVVILLYRWYAVQIQRRLCPSVQRNFVFVAEKEVKVELQQLVLAILDDPVVSRVFGEAEFQSCSIKLTILYPPPPILRFPHTARCPPLFLCNFAAGDDFKAHGLFFPFTLPPPP
uniref:Uncharacterized protein n=1 Tax=Ananas comosus var. bracteatus TaxID=296719 RepID=A0A6V7Q773_ANACO|nr:unnamed protein product [Ananas comosus var. bracteatus]